jgi:adenylate kinase
LRDRLRQGAEMGTGVAAKMQSGALVSDEVVNRLVAERIRRPEAAKGFVLDGYPRTLAQAEWLYERLDGRGIREVVIHLAVDYNVIIARLTGRRVCPKCGTLYNVVSKPPRVDSLCDLDGSRLAIRDDDSEAVIRERLDAYERQTQPVLEYYVRMGCPVVKVDASVDPPGVIFERVMQALNAQ